MLDEVKPAPDERLDKAAPSIDTSESPVPIDPRFVHLKFRPPISVWSIAALVLGTVIFCVDLVLLATDPGLFGKAWVVDSYQVTFAGLIHMPSVFMGMFLAGMGFTKPPPHRRIAWFALIQTFAVFFFGAALYWRTRF